MYVRLALTSSKTFALVDVDDLQISVQPFDVCEKSHCWVVSNSYKEGAKRAKNVSWDHCTKYIPNVKILLLMDASK